MSRVRIHWRRLVTRAFIERFCIASSGLKWRWSNDFHRRLVDLILTMEYEEPFKYIEMLHSLDRTPAFLPLGTMLTRSMLL